MISIQNEDTLHTPQIPSHFYRNEDSSAPKSPARETLIPTEISSAKESPQKKPKTPDKNKRPAKRKKTSLESLPPPNTVHQVNTPAIPVNYPDTIRLLPKCTVMLQYPAYATQAEHTATTNSTTVKERLQAALLVKNDSRKVQTVTVTPPSVDTGKVAIPAQPTLTIYAEEDKRLALPAKVPLAKTFKEFTVAERNLEASRRYRNRKKEGYMNLQLRNEQLEEENKRLRMENRELMERVKILESQGKSNESLK